MNQIQKVIKYLAIAFALFLTFSIISGIMYGVMSIGNLFDDGQVVTEQLKSLEISEDTLVLDIDVTSSNITIKVGDTFKVETNNKNITSKQDNNKLYIKEKKHNWFSSSKNTELVVSIPSDFIFDEVAIESGTGKVSIETLSTKKLDLDLGAGKVEIDTLTVLEEAKIDGGAGEMIITSSDIHNLDLDMGVGRLSLTCKLTGTNKIDSGVGEVNLSFLGTLEDYQIKLDKGLGTATLNGKNMNDNTNYGTGKNTLTIDGGVGSIQVKLIEE